MDKPLCEICGKPVPRKWDEKRGAWEVPSRTKNRKTCGKPCMKVLMSRSHEGMAYKKKRVEVKIKATPIDLFTTMRLTA